MIMSTINKIMRGSGAPGPNARRNVNSRPVKRNTGNKASKVPFKMFKRKIVFPPGGRRFNGQTKAKRRYVSMMRNNMLENLFYTDVKRHVIISMIIKSLLLHLTLPLFVGGGVAAVYVFYNMSTGETLPPPGDMLNIYILWLIIASAFAYRRISDGLQYYNARIILDKPNLNQTALHLYHTAPDLATDPELPVIEKYRKRHNKSILFPSSVERNVFPQMVDRTGYLAFGGDKDVETFNRDFTLAQLKREHSAARQIAQIKVEMHGGENEYDAMVKKYARRMDPSLRLIMDL